VELTIPAALGAATGKFGDGPALAEPGGPRISYHQLLHQTSTVTRALIAEGVRPGDQVAIWSPNRSSTASGSRRASWPAWSAAPPWSRNWSTTAGLVMSLVASERITVLILAARGVVLAAGGFERNAANRQRYQRPPVGAEWTNRLARARRSARQ
jgi:acyl-CoA synthetase (AMP-forming)/AMP-acid ligase II